MGQTGEKETNKLLSRYVRSAGKSSALAASLRGGQDTHYSHHARNHLLPFSPLLQSSASFLGLALSSLACCSWVVLQWLMLLVVGLGGSTTVLLLGRNEAPLLAVMAVLFALAGWFAGDRWAHLLNYTLAALTLLLALVVWLWLHQPTLLWALPPLTWLFLHRQQALFLAVSSALLFRFALWAWNRLLCGSAQAECCSSCRLKEGEE